MSYQEQIHAIQEKMKYKRLVVLFLIFLFFFDIYALRAFFLVHNTSHDGDIYFFDVGQGDSELVIFPEGGRILIDGGPPGGGALRALSDTFGMFENFVDIALLTHPERDHFGGFFDVFSRLPVRMLLFTGAKKETEAFREFERITTEKNIQKVEIFAGDLIRQGNASLLVVSPPRDKIYSSDSVNDSGLVSVLSMNGVRTLFSGDISAIQERELVNVISKNIDILKVAHHGSKYSSSSEFLEHIHPRIAVIEVGKNSYGHPSQETIDRISKVGSALFRTDRDGTIHVRVADHAFSVYSRGK